MGTLLVHVDHGAWMQELHFIEKKLLDKMRAACPDVSLHGSALPRGTWIRPGGHWES
jgi:hypothetical protein